MSSEDVIDKSGVRRVFTPRQPIDAESFLVGRRRFVEQAVGGLATGGGHLLIVGDRGIGKTSLANVVANKSRQRYPDGVFTHICTPADSLRDLVSAPLEKFGVDLTLERITQTDEEKRSGKVDFQVVGGGLEGGETTERTHISEAQRLNVRLIADRLASQSGLLVIDELDVLGRNEVTEALSSLIKQLSDRKSQFKVCLVGIAETMGQLLAGHESVSRALVEIRLPRLSDAEAREIVASGMQRLFLGMDDEVLFEIATVSSGYPYFVHLLALKCAERAITEPTTTIRLHHLNQVWEDVISESQGYLDQYLLSAIEHDFSSLPARVLSAAANLGTGNLDLATLVAQVRSLESDRDTKEAQITQCIHRLVREKPEILVQYGRRAVRFKDPRIPVYLRIRARADGTGGRS